MLLCIQEGRSFWCKSGTGWSCLVIRAVKQVFLLSFQILVLWKMWPEQWQMNLVVLAYWLSSGYCKSTFFSDLAEWKLTTRVLFVFQWYAIMLDYVGEYEGTKERISKAFKIKDHFVVRKIMLLCLVVCSLYCCACFSCMFWHLHICYFTVCPFICHLWHSTQILYQ